MILVEAWTEAPHGTRKRYNSGCRCEACRASNVACYHRRREEAAARASEVEPSGPTIPGTLTRGGVVFEVERCPGANGARCVRTPATWLRGQPVCVACVERATVWNGLVSAARTREHLLSLRAAGVGYKAVAAACDVAGSVLGAILAGRKLRIRAETERRVLEVDAGAVADHALVSAGPTRTRIRQLLRKGFTRAHLDELLGGRGRALQRVAGRRVLACTALRVEQLHAAAARGELVPRHALVDVSREVAIVRELLRLGIDPGWVTRELGCAPASLRDRARPRRAEVVTRFVAELEHGGRALELLREDDAAVRLPESWWTDAGQLRVAVRQNERGDRRRRDELLDLAHKLGACKPEVCDRG